MPGYPCCCTAKNSLYVPCCLYGIEFRFFGRSYGGTGGEKLKHLYLENMDNGNGRDVSADHGSVMTYGEQFSGVTYGSIAWYDWGLPITLENLFEPQPAGNWIIRMTFRNINLAPSTFELRDCVLRFSFFNPLDSALLTGFSQVVELYPIAVGGVGWDDSVNLVTPSLTSRTLLPSRTNSSELVLIYGAIPYGEPGQVRTSIHSVRWPFASFEFPRDGGPETRDFCMEFFKATDEPVRDNTSPALVVNCEQSPPCVECSCIAARPLDQGTCDNCRCTSNTPIKLGGFGPTAPEPSIVDITGDDNGKAVGKEWTVYGHGKILGPNEVDQTLLWVGYEDFQGNQPMTALALIRTFAPGVTEWRLWLVGLNGNLTYQEAADPTINEAWFFWWIVKKQVGQTVTYKFGIAPHSGGASVSPEIEAADMDFPGPTSDYDFWAILGDDPETSHPVDPDTSARLDRSYAGCVDGLGFKDSAATDEEMFALAHCSVSPPP